jgi:hypothetical protein
VLRSLEITAEVVGTAQGNVTHNLHWKQRIEIDLDCFLCARTGRRTVFEWGSSAATCTAHADVHRAETAAVVASAEVAEGEAHRGLRAERLGGGVDHLVVERGPPAVHDGPQQAAFGSRVAGQVLDAGRRRMVRVVRVGRADRG